VVEFTLQGIGLAVGCFAVATGATGLFMKSIDKHGEIKTPVVVTLLMVGLVAFLLALS